MTKSATALLSPCEAAWGKGTGGALFEVLKRDEGVSLRAAVENVSPTPLARLSTRARREHHVRMKKLFLVVLSAWRSLFIVGGVVGLLYLWHDIKGLPAAYGSDWETWAKYIPEQLTVAYIVLFFMLAWVIWIDVRPSLRKWLAERKVQVPPELEPVRDQLLMNGGLILEIRTNETGDRITHARVLLNLRHAAARAISYTVHKFRGAIEGAPMPDVDGPNPGGEMLRDELRTYNGGWADVKIGAGQFMGEVEWDISYGLAGNEPFHFVRRVRFSGVYNPATRRGEQIGVCVLNKADAKWYVALDRPAMKMKRASLRSR